MHHNNSAPPASCFDTRFSPATMREAFGPGLHAQVIFDRHLQLASPPTTRHSDPST